MPSQNVVYRLNISQPHCSRNKDTHTPTRPSSSQWGSVVVGEEGNKHFLPLTAFNLLLICFHFTALAFAVSLFPFILLHFLRLGV